MLSNAKTAATLDLASELKGHPHESLATNPRAARLAGLRGGGAGAAVAAAHRSVEKRTTAIADHAAGRAGAGCALDCRRAANACHRGRDRGGSVVRRQPHRRRTDDRPT